MGIRFLLGKYIILTLLFNCWSGHSQVCDLIQFTIVIFFLSSLILWIFSSYHWQVWRAMYIDFADGGWKRRKASTFNANLKIPPQPWGFLDEFAMLNYINIYFTYFICYSHTCICNCTPVLQRSLSYLDDMLSFSYCCIS